MSSEPNDSHVHLLARLRLPSRYESLASAAGDDLARLLVEPPNAIRHVFEDAAAGINAQARGLFAPVVARSGTGKSTLATNLTHWFGSSYTATAIVRGAITTGSLSVAAQAISNVVAPSNKRIIPLSVEDREFSAPTDIELTQIKSFLRSDIGSRCLVLWLETDPDRAEEISHRYIENAGVSPIPLPIKALGPPEQTWPDIASDTLRLVNGLESLEYLGVNPADFKPEDFRTLGDYLDAISQKFVSLVQGLLRSTQKPLRLTVVFATGSDGAGVLESFTGTGRFGGVEAQRLLAATPKSAIGKWWGDRPGLLTSVTYRLDTRVVALSPSTAVSILRRYGPPEVVNILQEVGVSSRSDADIVEYLMRSDLGKYLSGRSDAMSEIRGRPSPDAPSAFDLIGENYGFGLGHDKLLNGAVALALAPFNKSLDLEATVASEKSLSFVNLIPDIAVGAAELVQCLEFHWRRGDFLTGAHRSEAAQYILTKLRDYATALGWTEG